MKRDITRNIGSLPSYGTFSRPIEQPMENLTKDYNNCNKNLNFKSVIDIPLPQTFLNRSVVF